MIHRFSGFEFDADRHELRQDGRAVPLPPKPFSVLGYLIERRDRMVPKAELLDAFWAAEVSEAALQTTIRVIRKALGKEVGAAAIKTYHGQGFRFVASLDALDAPGPAATRDPVALSEQRLVSVLSIQIRAAPGQDQTVRATLDVARARIGADHGRLLHMMLDGFTAVFGLGEDGEDSARRAVACAWDVMASAPVAELGGAVVCGVETGAVVIGGTPEAEDWTPPGDIERQAADLARTGLSGTIVLGDTTRRILEGEVAVECTPAGHVLRAEPSGRAGIVARAPRGTGGFVGREAELAFLAAGASGARAGAGQAVLLSGSAGIGKSRLVREFLARTGAEGMAIATAQCLPRLASTPLAPVSDLCTALAQHAPDPQTLDPADRALLRRLLDPAAPPAEVLAGLSDHAIRDRSSALFTQVVGAACTADPLVIVVEDAHWIDPDSRAHLSDLIRDCDRLSLLVIVTTRPTGDTPLAERVLTLSPLGRDDCLRLLSSFPETARLSDPAAEALVRRAGGNPFFLEELALASPAGETPGQDLPDTVQAVMEARVATLEPAHRAVLYAIAVIGPPASQALVAGLLGLDPATLRTHIAHLVAAGFLTEGDTGVAFRHMLLHDTAYAMIAPPDRARLHGEVVRLLETGADPSRPEPLPETLALHAQEAGDTGRALDYWIRASNAAIYRAAGRAAIAFARQGLALIDPDRPESAAQEMRLQLSLAPALMAQSGYGAEEVGRAYRRAHHLSERTGSDKARMRALLGLWVHTWVAGRLGESLLHSRALLEIAERTQDNALRLQGHGGIGAVLTHMSDLDGARRHLDAGLALIGTNPPDTITLQNAAVNCAAYAAWVAALRGDTPAMRANIARSEDLGTALANPFATAIHLSLCANILMSVGEVGPCRTFADRAVELSRSQRYPFWLGTGLVLQGWAEGRAGDPIRGLELIDEGIGIFDATGSGIQTANWLGIRAETCLAAGEIDAGLEAAMHGLRKAESYGDSWFVPRIHAIAAALCAKAGRDAEAVDHARKARHLAQKTGLSPMAFDPDGALPTP
ncbi:adenylate cyclase [Primorskyibacter flagellatus]|uniref:Adenylate cyclase n=1 Tax=Primorskyibacter flagellatus TaxID=1387277 RepID=A0A916ZWI4_9RHOB|nr:AAA family ATPase [Primorskyibacter flagellatus]GGE16358.1 adenylate cyclase [Primorskyibacter flagellatus]